MLIFIKRTILFTCLITSSFIAQAKSLECGGESGYNFVNDRDVNPRKGGFVGDGAYVDENAFIAPTASVCGSATVEGHVKILGNAVVKGGAYIANNVRITGNAIVGGTAHIEGSYKKSPVVIQGYARIFDGTITEGKHGSNKKPKDVLIKEKELENKEREKARKHRILELTEDINYILHTTYNNTEYHNQRKRKTTFPSNFFGNDCSINGTNITLKIYEKRPNGKYKESRDISYENFKVNLKDKTLFMRSKYSKFYQMYGDDFYAQLLYIAIGYKKNAHKFHPLPMVKTFKALEYGDYSGTSYYGENNYIKLLNYTDRDLKKHDETIAKHLNELSRLCGFDYSENVVVQ